MEYFIFAALVAALFKRPLRKLLYGIVGLLLFSLAVITAFAGDLSFMELSKLEMLFLAGIFLLSRSNTLLDRKVNEDWFLSTESNASMGWLYSKFTDFVWIGLLPLYYSLLEYALYLLSEVSDVELLNDDIDALYNTTVISAALLVYLVLILILRNVRLRFQLSRLESEPVEATSESTEKEEVSNG
jgi:hypothetical protein